jgi:hypothetical protein
VAGVICAASGAGDAAAAKAGTDSATAAITTSATSAMIQIIFLGIFLISLCFKHTAAVL